MNRRISLTLLIALGAAFAPALANDLKGRPDAPSEELHFVRLAYDTRYVCGNNSFMASGFWEVDYPNAEYFFHQGVSRLTRVAASETSRAFSLLDDALFDYPFLYAVEVGHWYLTDAEAERLREYLLRGGFLMVDDFHGGCEWTVFTESLKRVFPDRPIIDIPEDHEIFGVLYDLDRFTQIYGVRLIQDGSVRRGITYEVPDDTDPHWRGIYDDDGRLMLAINHNMDLGDAWEHADDPIYPAELTALAYRFAVNYVIYAMTH